MQLSTFFFIIGFLAVYSCLFVTQIIPLFSNREAKSNNNITNKKMGRQLISIKYEPINSKQKNMFLVFSLLLFFVSIAVLIIWNLEYSLPFLAFSIIFIAILKSQYSNDYGIYENGIIFGDLLPWSKVHSWKIESNQDISILKTNGFSFTLSEQCDEISKILKAKNINQIYEATSNN
ncbi:MAG: hypothetical protein GX297_00885 [Treponema sp.]|jgi:hypothetical protein|nr:hypothetical protein [Treponema sp.]